MKRGFVLATKDRAEWSSKSLTFFDVEWTSVESPAQTKSVEDPRWHDLGPQTSDGVNQQLNYDGWEVDCGTSIWMVKQTVVAIAGHQKDPTSYSKTYSIHFQL